MRSSGSIIPFPDRIIEDYPLVNGGRAANQIDEEDENDDDTGNVSESMTQLGSTSQTPLQNLRIENKGMHSGSERANKLQANSSQPTTGGHTRSNSSKAQSLKGSIILQKPALSSQFSSIVLNQYPYGISSSGGFDKRIQNQQLTLREAFNGIINSDKLHCGDPINHHSRQRNELSHDINQYLQQVPGSFVCTGGTEFQYESGHQHSNAQQMLQDLNKAALFKLTPESHSVSKLSGPKSTVIKHTSEESKSSLMFSPTYLNEDSFTPLSPLAFFDESNRKVAITSSHSNKKDKQERWSAQQNKKLKAHEGSMHDQLVSWEQQENCQNIIGVRADAEKESAKIATKPKNKTKQQGARKKFISPIKTSKKVLSSTLNSRGTWTNSQIK